MPKVTTSDVRNVRFPRTYGLNLEPIIRLNVGSVKIYGVRLLKECSFLPEWLANYRTVWPFCHEKSLQIGVVFGENAERSAKSRTLHER